MRSALALLLLSVPVSAHAQSPERPSWGEAWLASAGAGAGLLAGGYLGLHAELAMTPADCGCLTGLVGGVGGGTLGAGVGALAVRTSLGQRRGSVLGAMAGTAAGVFVGAMVPIDPEGRANAVIMPALGAAVGAVGYRYGPWAKGPGRAARVAVVPHGAGAYAVVRF